MRVSVISANLGHYDLHVPWREDQIVPDGVEVTFHRLTDETFSGRHKAMLPALKCGIPKMFGADLFPGADRYLWVDASCALLRPDSVAWFLGQLGHAELLLFLHPDRRTIREEYEFMKERMARPGETYLNGRYCGEWLDEMYLAVNQPWFRDDRLYASTAFMYRPTLRVKQMLRDWWYFKTRFLTHDQLALPYVVREHGVYTHEMAIDYRKCDYLTYVRNKDGQRKAREVLRTLAVTP